MPDARVLDRFTSAEIDAVRRLAEQVERARGAEPFGETTWLGLEDGGSRGDIGLLLDGPDGTPDAYAHAARYQAGAWSLEAASRPGAPDRRASVIRDALAVVGDRGGGRVTLWVHGADDADDRVARAGGLAPDRDVLELRVPLPLATPVHWPLGVSARTFVPGTDEDAWVVVNNRAFAGHPEQGGWDAGVLVRREAEAWFDPAGFLLAFDEAGLAGFCWTKVHPPHPPAAPVALGEIYVIGVDPGRQGTGLGRALVVAGLDSLWSRGTPVGMLFVDGDNGPARALYSSLGFTVHRVDRAYTVDVERAR